MPRQWCLRSLLLLVATWALVFWAAAMAARMTPLDLAGFLDTLR